MELLKTNTIEKIQKIFLEDFSQTIPTKDIFLSLLIAILAAIIINFIYKKTYNGVSYTKSFSLSIILLTLVTSLVIRTINSNLALSLGMVGALSIVRFRTAVKDPIDTIFMFWAITAGIMSGAGLYVATLISTITISIFYFLCCVYESKKKDKLLLVIKSTIVKSDKILELMKEQKKCDLKTESYKNNTAELTYEIYDRKAAERILDMKDEEGIISINILDMN